MSNAYADLIERIREKCRQQRWYGPDLQSPAYIQELSARYGPKTHFSWLDDQGNSHRINLDTDLSQLPIPQKFA